MIDYNNRLIFIHVPRTAGTALVEAMGRGANPDWRLEHWAWHKYKQFFPDLWSTFRKVAVRRNPDAHMKSWHQYHRMWFADHMQWYNYAPYNCTYDEWVRRGCPWHEDWTACGVDGSPVYQQPFHGPPQEGVTLLPFEDLHNAWAKFVKENNLPESFITNLGYVNKGPSHEM